jgi:two-component system NtrC family sensor kinase
MQGMRAMNERKIVIIDDDKEIRDAMCQILSSFKYQVFAAENGPSGIEMLLRENPSIVLTDIKMPGMDGIEVLKKVKERSPDTEVIVVTGHADMDVAIQALQLEASDFITKPISKEALTIALKRAEQKVWLRKKLSEHTQDLERRIKKTTDELGQRHAFERNLIQASMDGIIANDREGNIIVFNEGAERIVGYSRDEAISKVHVEQLYPEGVARQIKKLIHGQEYGGPGRLVNYEVDMVTKNGKLIPILLSAILVYDKGEEAATVGYFKDMSEIKRLEQELFASERIAAMGKAVAGIAHGVRNILHRMKLGAFMVDQALEQQKPEMLRKGWNLVKNNMDQISKMNMEMVRYASTSVPARISISLNALVDEVCGAMQQKAQERGVSLIRELDPSLPQLIIDPEGMHLCLLNLVTNAIEAFPERGEGGHVVVSSHDAGDAGVRLQVKDTGRGMSKELQEQIFNHLISTKGARGTGLGLAVTQKIVREHGGTIQVVSAPSEGSCFTIVLPKKISTS